MGRTYRLFLRQSLSFCALALIFKTIPEVVLHAWREIFYFLQKFTSEIILLLLGSHPKVHNVHILSSLKVGPTSLPTNFFVLESSSGVSPLGTDYVPAMICQANRIGCDSSHLRNVQLNNFASKCLWLVGGPSIWGFYFLSIDNEIQMVFYQTHILIEWLEYHVALWYHATVGNVKNLSGQSDYIPLILHLEFARLVQSAVFMLKRPYLKIQHWEAPRK